MKTKVLFADGLSSEGVSVLEASKDCIDYEIVDGLKRSELLLKLKETEILCIRTRTGVDREVIDAAPKLKLIARAGVGVDHIDLRYALSKNIRCMNTSSASTTSVAELTLGLLLAAARGIAHSDKATHAGQWKQTLGIELYGKTVGIIGLGRIGRLVALRLQAFGLKVLASDPYRNVETVENLGVRLMPFKELLSNCDIVSLHTPLTAETRFMMNREAFAKMNEGVILINTARGEVVDEKAVLEALSSQKLGFYAADVFSEEPLNVQHPFLNHPRILLSPHNGAQTKEAQNRVNRAIASQVIVFAKTGQIQNEISL